MTGSSKTKSLATPPRTSDGPELLELQRRADAMTRGDFTSLGQPLDGSRDGEALRRAIDVMGEHLQQAQRSIQEYVTASLAAQEAERNRLARELHDETVQQIIALGQGIERAQRLVGHDPAQATERLKALRATTTTLVRSLRAVIGDLRPPALEELGLVSAVELMLGRRDSNAPKVALSVRGKPRRLDAVSELALFRIVQESWSNIVKHASAKHAKLTFSYTRRALVITISDDGTGIAPASAEGDKRTDRESTRRHWGLVGMDERAKLMNGSFSVENNAGRGTRVIVRVSYLALDGRDPVCGMQVGPDGLTVEYHNMLYRFCSDACRDAFRAEPHRYVTPPALSG